MRRGVFIIYKPIDEERPSGIEKKILKQCECFKSVGIFVETFVAVEFPGLSSRELDYISQFDFIYFRKQHTVDVCYVEMLHKIKKKNPNCKIYMDIPTYPYQGEYNTSLRGRISLMIDSFFCHFLKGIVDKVILTGEQSIKDFHKIKTINILNGIELRGFPADVNSCEDGIIRIGCIGRFSPWHGYERIIEGLANYYSNGGTRIVSLLFAGDGPELAAYKRLVENYQLENNVSFLGHLSESELDEVLSQLDFGCCSLGRYKSRLDVIGDLKSREYLANGIPLITGCDIDILKPIDFCYQVKYRNDQSPIEIDRIVDFYDKHLKYKKNEVRKSIYKIVESLINIENTYKPVLEEAKQDLSKI